MTRFLVLVIMVLIFTINVALSTVSKDNARNTGRSLPEYDIPTVVQQVLQSSAGEMHFVATEKGENKNIFLRTREGIVCEIDQIIGDDSCKNLADIAEKDRQDTRCVFIFEKGHRSCHFQIYSYELRDSSLFAIIKSIHARKRDGERRVN